MKVLLVDDDAIIRRMFEKVLQRAGFDVILAADAEHALEKVSQPVDIIVSDIRMPGLSGLDLLRHVRERHLDCEVILMTSYASVDTAIQALREGAFDYLTKPVSQDKLLASLERAKEELLENRQRRKALSLVEAGLKQIMGQGLSGIFNDTNMTNNNTLTVPNLQASLGPTASTSVANITPATVTHSGVQTGGQFQIGPVLLDLDRFVIEVNSERIEVTPSEFEILHVLCRNPDRVLTPQELVQAIRGYSVETWEAKDVIRPHISNLRRKLTSAAPEADIIGTVRSVGYILRVPIPI